MKSVPISDFAIANANERVASEPMEKYYSCCVKTIICKGCLYSFCKSGNNRRCPFCNSDRADKTVEKRVGEVMRRVEANDAESMCMLAHYYYRGEGGFQQDHARAMELYARAADLGCIKAHGYLAGVYHEGGFLKKARVHIEAAAMAGDEVARANLGIFEMESGNIERAVKH
jgi:hypothetical protein